MIEEELPPNEKFVQGQKIFYPNIYSFKVTTKTLKKDVKYVQCSICDSASIHNN